VGEALRGPTGFAYTEQDPVAPARVLTEFASATQGRPRLKAGLLEGRVYLEQELEALAKLPPRQVLLGQMVTAIQSPLSGLAFCLQGILQKLVGTLHAVAEKKRNEGDGDAPSEAS
jgi:large subunit ribosomal protein L10